jgi:hypothetical protein
LSGFTATCHCADGTDGNLFLGKAVFSLDFVQQTGEDFLPSFDDGREDREKDSFGIHYSDRVEKDVRGVIFDIQ